MSTPEVEPSSPDARTTMRAPSIWSTTPARLATMVAPESRATAASMPVPTSGASARISGTAWRCMLEPISARLASSFSRNGISAAATDTSWRGDTSTAVTSSGLTRRKSPRLRTETSSWLKCPTSSVGASACATTSRSSSMAERYFQPSCTVPSFTRRYGVSMKPYLFTLA